ncbi:DUF397 domain-containing protein [Streptomyces mangrovi]|uniref:DUF397 domain-containing protein n=1 Tax=Streptomyces mangrovi TaxID=1206892 RepID=A0ABV9J1I1_9ACTN
MSPHSPAAVPVRDSKRPDGPMVVVHRAAWSAFLTGLRHSA